MTRLHVADIWRDVDDSTPRAYTWQRSDWRLDSLPAYTWQIMQFGVRKKEGLRRGVGGSHGHGDLFCVFDAVSVDEFGATPHFHLPPPKGRKPHRNHYIDYRCRSPAPTPGFVHPNMHGQSTK
jgi:hypothetical protein